MNKYFWKEVLMTGLRVFGYTAVFGFIGFMFTPALIESSAALRIPILGLLILGAAMLFFTDGSFRGERDITMSETLDKLAKKGTYSPTAQEEAKRYRPLKGILGALCGALPLLICAILVAITAKPYVYGLQDYPAWITSYSTRPEIVAPLSYMQLDSVSASVFDYLRIGVRFFLFPYVGLFGVMTDEVSLLFDRVSPLLSLILPLVAAVGYMFGPARHRKNVKAIEEAKRTPRKRLKKDRAKKNGPREKQQLI